MQDVQSRVDIERIVARFYADTLAAPIMGFIFTDIAKIDLPAHLPLISDFWEDALFGVKPKRYAGNVLSVHQDLANKIALRKGHFTRWLYLFERSVDAFFQGENADRMKLRANSVAKSISAAITTGKRNQMRLTLDVNSINSGDSS